jgi:hypothetical protein
MVCVAQALLPVQKCPWSKQAPARVPVPHEFGHFFSQIHKQAIEELKRIVAASKTQPALQVSAMIQ